MADDQDVQASEITPEDFNADEQVSPKAESSPADDKKPEGEDKQPEAEKPAEAEVSPEGEEAKPDEAKPAEAEPEDEAKPEDKLSEDKPPKPKSENRFQNLANENRSLREQVEKLTSEHYRTQTTEELAEEVNPDTGERYTRGEARAVALEQRLELKEYGDKIASAQSALGYESFQVLEDFPIFNDKSDQYDKELALEAAELMEANLIRDPQIPELGPDGKETGKGLVIGSNVSPYKLYKTIARATGISATKAQIKGQQAAESMLANADTTTSVAPAKKAADPLAELWKDDL